MIQKLTPEIHFINHYLGRDGGPLFKDLNDIILSAFQFSTGITAKRIVSDDSEELIRRIIASSNPIRLIVLQWEGMLHDLEDLNTLRQLPNCAEVPIFFMYQSALFPEGLDCLAPYNLKPYATPPEGADISDITPIIMNLVKPALTKLTDARLATLGEHIDDNDNIPYLFLCCAVTLTHSTLDGPVILHFAAFVRNGIIEKLEANEAHGYTLFICNEDIAEQFLIQINASDPAKRVIQQYRGKYESLTLGSEVVKVV